MNNSHRKSLSDTQKRLILEAMNANNRAIETQVACGQSFEQLMKELQS